MNKLGTFLLSAVSLLATACAGSSSSAEEELYQRVPFDMPRVERPSIPQRQVSLAGFGAACFVPALRDT